MDYNTADWAQDSDGNFYYVGKPMEDDHGREAAQDRATWYDLR